MKNAVFHSEMLDRVPEERIEDFAGIDPQEVGIGQDSSYDPISLLEFYNTTGQEVSLSDDARLFTDALAASLRNEANEGELVTQSALRERAEDLSESLLFANLYKNGDKNERAEAMIQAAMTAIFGTDVDRPSAEGASRPVEIESAKTVDSYLPNHPRRVEYERDIRVLAKNDKILDRIREDVEDLRNSANFKSPKYPNIEIPSTSNLMEVIEGAMNEISETAEAGDEEERAFAGDLKKSLSYVAQGIYGGGSYPDKAPNPDLVSVNFLISRATTQTVKNRHDVPNHVKFDDAFAENRDAHIYRQELREELRWQLLPHMHFEDGIGEYEIHQEIDHKYGDYDLTDRMPPLAKKQNSANELSDTGDLTEDDQAELGANQSASDGVYRLKGNSEIFRSAIDINGVWSDELSDPEFTRTYRIGGAAISAVAASSASAPVASAPHREKPVEKAPEKPKEAGKQGEKTPEKPDEADRREQKTNSGEAVKYDPKKTYFLFKQPGTDMRTRIVYEQIEDGESDDVDTRYVGYKTADTIDGHYVVQTFADRTNKLNIGEIMNPSVIRENIQIAKELGMPELVRFMGRIKKKSTSRARKLNRANSKSSRSN